MKREYCRFYYSWRKCNVPTVIVALVKSNLKRQMEPKEGLLFIKMLKRTHNRRKKGRGKK